MAISKEDCTSIEIEDGTIGGSTYYVRHPKWNNEERAICCRPVKNIPGYDRANMFCERAAGWRTDHEGEGSCRTHGGSHSSRGRQYSTGERSVATKKHLKKRVDDFIEKDKNDLMNLDTELAAMKLLFQDLLEMFPESHEDEGYGMYMNQAMKLVNIISDVVDKISKIESRNTITVNQVMYLRVRLATMFTKYIEDPEKRQRALRELVASMPGGDESAIVSGDSYILDSETG